MKAYVAVHEAGSRPISGRDGVHLRAKPTARSRGRGAVGEGCAAGEGSSAKRSVAPISTGAVSVARYAAAQ